MDKKRKKRGKEERKMRKKGGGEKKRRKKKEEGEGFRGVEERWYWQGYDLILITLDRHECFSVFHHLQKDKKRKQRHSLKLGNKRRESSTRICCIISPRVIIKAIIITYCHSSSTQIRLPTGSVTVWTKLLARYTYISVDVVSKWTYLLNPACRQKVCLCGGNRYLIRMYVSDIYIYCHYSST